MGRAHNACLHEARPAEPRSSIARVPTARGIWENVVATFVVLAVLAALGFITSTIETPIPLWLTIALAIAALGIGMVIGLLRRDYSDLPAYQADLLGEAMLALRDYAAGAAAGTKPATHWGARKTSPYREPPLRDTPSTRKNSNGPTTSKPTAGGSLIRKPTRSAAINPSHAFQLS